MTYEIEIAREPLAGYHCFTVTLKHTAPILPERTFFQARDSHGQTTLFYADVRVQPVHFVARADAPGARQYLITPVSQAEKGLS